MKKNKIQLFNGRVTCESYSELISVCGSHRRDLNYIKSYGSPEAMAMSLLACRTEEACIEKLNEGIKERRGVMTFNRLKFRSIPLGNGSRVLEHAALAIREYLAAHPNLSESVDQDVIDDLVTMGLNSGDNIRGFVQGTFKHKGK